MTVVLTHDALKDAVDDLLDQPAFAFDLETIGTDPDTGYDVRLDPRRNTVVWISLASGGGRRYTVPVGHPIGKQIGTEKRKVEQANGRIINKTFPVYSAPPKQIPRADAFEILEPLFMSETILTTGFNLKWDLETIEKYYDGVPLPGPHFDAQVASHALNENRFNHKLGPTVEREFGFKYDKKMGEQIERYPFKEAQLYAHLDGHFHWLLYLLYAPLLPADQLDGLWQLETDVFEVLLHMENTAVPIDIERATEMLQELGRDIDRLRGDLFRIAGREINLNSNPQMQELLFGKKADGGFGLRPKKFTKGGRSGDRKPSTDKEALEHHEGHPFVDTYLELQTVDRLHGTYLKSWLGGERRRETGGKVTIETVPSILVEHNDGTRRIHPSFKQHGTVTGRFSCSEPNLQNIPRGETELGQKMRSLFVAPPGHVLVVADYSQIEYRVLAHYSRDKMLIKAFADGLDFHQYVAAMLLGKPMEEVTKPERTVSKNTNFAVVYGAGDDKIASMSKVSLAQAESFHLKHKKMLPKVYDWTHRTVVECRRARPPHITTLLGRKRRLPEINSPVTKLRSRAERQAVNAKIQGSAADIIKVAMVRTHGLCDDEIKLVLSVHDELMLVAPEDRADDAQEILRRGMLGPGIQEMLSVPLAIDMKVGAHWAEAK